MSGFVQFGFGTGDNNVGGKRARFKMAKNETARISLLWWPGLDVGTPNLDSPTPLFVGAPRHYLKGVGYFINKGPEYTRIAGDEAKMRINTLIVKWPLNAQGALDPKAISEGGFEVMYWVFDEGKYNELKPIQAEWPLGQHDLMIKCSDAGFQKMSFTPCKDSILRRLLEKPESELAQTLITRGQSLLPHVRNEIGRDMTLDQIREKLAGGGAAATGAGAVGAAAAAATSDDMDDALNRLLDD